MIKRVASVILLSYAFGTSVFADEIVPQQPTESQKKIEQIIIQAEIEARKETYEEIERTEKLNKTMEIIGDIEDTTTFKNKVNQKLNKKLAKYGIKKVEADVNETFTTMATSPSTTVVDLGTPAIYSSSQGYIIKASVYWKKKPSGTWYWYDHAPCCGLGTLNVGGADGLGIYFSNSNNLEISKTSFYTYDENGSSYNTNLYPYRINSAGAYYRAQDTMTNSTFNPYHNYTWHSSHITVWPNFIGSVNTYARTHWTHTWSSADITGVSISNSGISVNIESSSNAWDGVSTGSVNVKSSK